MARKQGFAKFPVFSGGLESLPQNLEGAYDQVPPVPDDFTGNATEWRVFWWLTREKMEFDFQGTLLGGRKMLGGQVADFIIYSRDPVLILNVQGEHWHYAGSGLSAEALMNKVTLLNRGFDVVYVREDDVLSRLDYTMRQAMLGIQLYPD